MKTKIYTIVFVAFLITSCGSMKNTTAEYDDLYYIPSKEVEKQQQSAMTTNDNNNLSNQDIVEKPMSDYERYYASKYGDNRNYDNNNSSNYTEDETSDTLEERYTKKDEYVYEKDGDTYVINNYYYGDYDYAYRIYRFHRPYVYIGYYDIWYDPWYDPWWYDPWYDFYWYGPSWRIGVYYGYPYYYSWYCTGYCYYSGYPYWYWGRPGWYDGYYYSRYYYYTYTPYNVTYGQRRTLGSSTYSRNRENIIKSTGTNAPEVNTYRRRTSEVQTSTNQNNTTERRRINERETSVEVNNNYSTRRRIEDGNNNQQNNIERRTVNENRRRIESTEQNYRTTYSRPSNVSGNDATEVQSRRRIEDNIDIERNSNFARPVERNIYSRPSTSTSRPSYSGSQTSNERRNVNNRETTREVNREVHEYTPRSTERTYTPSSAPRNSGYSAPSSSSGSRSTGGSSERSGGSSSGGRRR